MILEQLDKFLEFHTEIEYNYDNTADTFYFRDTTLPWYTNNPNNSTAITGDKMMELSNEDLLKAIRKGLEIEGITRITGYFTKVGNWNKGKLGELRDRNRNKGAFS